METEVLRAERLTKERKAKSEKSLYVKTNIYSIRGNMFKNGAFTLFIVLLLLAINVSAYDYQINYYTANNNPSIAEIEAISFKTTKSCEARYSNKVTIDGNDFDVSVVYFSPDNEIVGAGQIDDVTNISCLSLFFGNTEESENGFYEGYTQIIHSGTTDILNLKAYYDCETTDYYFNTSIDAINDADSYGNVPLRLTQMTSATAPPSNISVIEDIYASNYYDCDSEFEPTSYQNYAGSSGVASDISRTVVAYYPFNASSKYVNYNFNLGNSSFPILECSDLCAGTTNAWVYVYLVDTIDESYTSIYSELGDCATLPAFRVTGTLSGTLNNLIRDRLYSFVFIVAYDDTPLACSRSYEVREPEEADIDIFVYEGNFECTDWSVCDDEGKQYRTCVDQNGIAPNEFESRTCSLTVLENATFGFENSSNRWVTVCQPTFGFDCNYQIFSSFKTEVPEDWTIVDSGSLNYFIQMTEKWATEGTRSLMMWVIPPNDGEPNSGGSACINLSQSRYPQIYKQINDSFLLEFNVTFPAENMILRYDVKACDEQVLRHSNYGGILWSNISGEEYYLVQPSCYKSCYSDSCESEPLSDYQFNIVDTVTSQSLIGNPFYDEGESLTKSPVFNLENINTSRTYNVVFATVPENVLDRSGQCIMIDNVRYEVTEEPLTSNDICGSDCKSKCIANDYYQCITLSNGVCSAIINYDSDRCVDDETAESIRNLEPYCKDINTVKKYDSKTGLYEEISCTGENVCDEGACVESVIEATDYLTTNEIFESTTALLFQLFTWALVITLLSMIGTALLLGLFGVNDMRPALGTGLVVNIFFIIATWTPIWWGLMISAGLIILISGKLVNLSGTGGG